MARALFALLLQLVAVSALAGGAVTPSPWFSDSSSAPRSDCGTVRSCGTSAAEAADAYAEKLKAAHDAAFGCGGTVTKELEASFPSFVPPQWRYGFRGSDSCPGGWNDSPATSYLGSVVVSQRASECPPNSTGTAASGCTCASGWQPTEAGTACQQECNAGRVVSAGWYDVGTSASGKPVTLGCSAQCEVIYDGYGVGGSSQVNGVKHYFAKGSYIVTGAACSPGDQAPNSPSSPGADGGPPAPTCAPGQAPGKVNGLDVCVNQGTGQPSGPGSDGSSGGSHGTTTTTNNPGGGTTTTTTTEDTWTNPDGSQGGSTTTTIVDCDAEGNCEFSEVEEGDTKPEDQTECEREPDKLGCAELGELGEQPLLPNVALSGGISPDGGWMTGGSCPADESIALSFGSVVFPWSKLCTFAQGIRPFVIGLAWFSGALIFLGLSRKA